MATTTFKEGHTINNNFDLKKKALLDERLLPVDSYSNLPDPNLPSKFIPEGATILVRDTGLNYQAQIDPLNTNNLIWVVVNPAFAGSITGVPFISLTYSALNILYSANNLQKGAFYKITDRADAGIVLQALDTKELSLHGSGIFLVPDYQSLGNYTGTPLAYGNTYGVWFAALESTISTGDVVIYNGFMYQCISNVTLNGTAPDVNNLAYSLLTKSITNGYIKEVDLITYNFETDTILSRKDKRNNIVNNGVHLFQWGNDLTYKNTIENSANFENINSRGTIYNNYIGNSAVVICDNTHEGLLRNNTFRNRGFTYTCNANAGLTLLNHCTVELDENITFLATKEYAYLSCTSYISSFDADLNMSVDFAAGVLTIPTNLNYVGSFKLKNNNNQIITKILNLPSFYAVRFAVQNGNTQNFSHTPIGSAVAGNLVSDTAIPNAIVGRNTSSDIIEYQLTGVSAGVPLCRRYNIVKLA